MKEFDQLATFFITPFDKFCYVRCHLASEMWALHISDVCSTFLKTTSGEPLRHT
jgi:hypothetical protein